MYRQVDGIIMYNDVELRKMPAGSLCCIADILETNSDWKKVMSLVPKDPSSPNFEPKYNNEHIRLIEDHSQKTGRKCSEILFDEWGTSGRNRPTLSTLKDVIIKAQVYRAADEIAKMLKEQPPERPLDGPAALIDTEVSKLINELSMEQKLQAMEPIKKHTNGSSTKNTNTSNTYINNKTTAQMKSLNSQLSHSDVANVSYLPDLSVMNFQNNDLDNMNGHSRVSNVATEDSEIKKIRSCIPIDQDSQSDAPSPNADFQTSIPDLGSSNSCFQLDSHVFEDRSLIHFEYNELQQITNNFSSHCTVGVNGPMGLIGKGGFGHVFVGFHPTYGPLAIKQILNNLTNGDIEVRNSVINMWKVEINFLSSFRHKNVVHIIGYSNDGPSRCIICEYIDGGSLYEKLHEKVLNERQRIIIMLGTADGLKYLHTSDQGDIAPYITKSTGSQHSKKNFVHGDVKSANILLTRNFVPKLCDFGLAFQYETTQALESPMGTNAYMAPEGFSGIISQKIDIYSFGIVLLELLTGLKPNVTTGGERMRIKQFIKETCSDGNLSRVLDPAVPVWTRSNEIYELANKCMLHNRNERPRIEDICDIIRRW